MTHSRDGTTHVAFPGRGHLRRRVPEQQALAELPGAVVKLMADLDRRGWEVDHGGHQTHFTYQGHCVGGVNRKYGHAYLSKLIGPVLGDDHLNALGFKLREDTKEKSSFAGHRWYEVVLIDGLVSFERALAELERLIDSARREPR